MVSRGRPYNVVEIKPERVTPPVSMAPSTPPGSKSVRFAPCVKSEARKLTPTEAWSLYNFETHARGCAECYSPIEVVRAGQRLCPDGHALALDVAEHVYQSDSQIYSTHKDNHKHVRVEMPKEYDHVRQLLRCMDRALRTYSRPAPVISYDRSYPVSARHTSKHDKSSTVIVEPNTSTTRRSKHKSSRYSTTAVPEDSEPHAVKRPDYVERRGSLYETDLKSRRKEAYKVEVREPEREERRRHRREGAYYE